MADFKPPPLSSHEGPADFTPPPLDSHEGPDQPKAPPAPKPSDSGALRRFIDRTPAGPILRHAEQIGPSIMARDIPGTLSHISGTSPLNLGGTLDMLNPEAVMGEGKRVWGHLKNAYNAPDSNTAAKESLYAVPGVGGMVEQAAGDYQEGNYAGLAGTGTTLLGTTGGGLRGGVPGLPKALQNLKTFTSGAASYRPSPSGALIRGALVPAAETAGHFLGLPPGVASAADAATMLPGMIKAGMKAVRGANGEITYIPGPKGGTTESTIGGAISYPQGEGPFGSTTAPPHPGPPPTTPSQAKTSIKLQKDSLINTMTPNRAKEIFSELEGQPARGDLSEMGFESNPPGGPQPQLNVNKKTNQALKANKVANELYTAGVPKDAALALQNAPEEVQNQFWSDLEEGYRNPKTKKIPDNRVHSGETRNLILDNLLKLHQEAQTQTPSSPIPQP